ncbi:hypothetical protein BT63DRAFT_412126 [Microthyrium microscopicum]|uniref:C3H1-type domain-containing protein n=1 Tax=Microthyrium microscopicum TaxID=703497 RepID=A0A6A6UHZ4_9PEZI|nr:hypothetical protein BT63DRAFT_412126 [Microthyrium microscopicum]
MSQPQPFNGSGRAHTAHNSRSSADLRARVHASGPNGHAGTTNGHGPGPVPVPRAGNGNLNGHGDSRGGFAGARSPPGPVAQKNTSHVPCKFFRSSGCQAGKSCPFAHVETSGACKYFAKGNCKFGMRCANEHVFPDGRRINKQSHLSMVGAQQQQMNFGGRVAAPQAPPQVNSLLSMQQDQFNQPAYGMPTQMMDYSQNNGFEPIPTIEATGSSLPTSAIGSPQNDSMLARSPAARGLSLRDVGLPASFDSQGISYIARHGPVAASVPAHFGFDTSPPSSLLHSRPMDSTAVRNLHSSAFGDGTPGMSNLGMSPALNEGSFGQRMPMRMMHSERYARPSKLSSSVGTKMYLPAEVEDDYDFNEAFDEDLNAIPDSLNDLLTPNERRRRLSRNAEDDTTSNHRAALSGIGTPMGESPKVGSPGALGVSPSRFGPLFQRQQREKSEATINETVTNAFGHVGSPLRPSPLNHGSSPSLRATNSRPTSGDFSISSPPRHSSMGMITQQMQRARISSRGSDSAETNGTTTASLQHPGIQRVASGSGTSSAIGVPPNRLDRSMSGASSTGVGREKIEEEPEEVFDMDEIHATSNKWKRQSGTNGIPIKKATENGTGPGVIGGQRNGT